MIDRTFVQLLVETVPQFVVAVVFYSFCIRESRSQRVSYEKMIDDLHKMVGEVIDVLTDK